MCKKIIYAITLLVIVLGSCKREKYWKVRDLTTEKKLTGAVKGIASIPGGSTFVLYYEKEGALGIVDSLGRSEQYNVLPAKATGNAIRFDKSWNMYIADSVNCNILVMKSGERSLNVFTGDSSLQSIKLLAVMDNGTLFTTGTDKGGNHIYKAISGGGFVSVESGLGVIGGIEVSPGDKYFYVSEANNRKIWRYNLDTAGNISGKKEFYSFPDFQIAGMRCDTLGNLFVCRYNKGTVAVLSPEGKLLREIELKGKKVSDIAFGGYDGKSVFITLQDQGKIETFFSDIPGREWALFQR